MNLVAEAQDQKPKVQRLLDRFAHWYTPLAMALAALSYVFTRACVRQLDSGSVDIVVYERGLDDAA